MRALVVIKRNRHRRARHVASARTGLESPSDHDGKYHLSFEVKRNARNESLDAFLMNKPSFIVLYSINITMDSSPVVAPADVALAQLVMSGGIQDQSLHLLSNGEGLAGTLASLGLRVDARVFVVVTVSDNGPLL